MSQLDLFTFTSDDTPALLLARLGINPAAYSRGATDACARCAAPCCTLYPNIPLPDFPADKIKHHALHDAEHEAHVLAVLLQTLAAPGSSSLPEDFARLYRSRVFGQILAIRQDADDTPQIAFHAQPEGLGVCQKILSYDDIDLAERAVAGMFRCASQLKGEAA